MFGELLDSLLPLSADDSYFATKAVERTVGDGDIKMEGGKPESKPEPMQLS